MRDTRSQSMTLPSDPIRLREARRWLVRLAVDAGLSATEGHDLAVAFSEVCANVHRHAYGGRRDGRVEVAVRVDAEALVVSVDHHGERFDPRAYMPPDLARPAEGGYGLYLISRLVDGVSFEGTQRGGRVVLVKHRSSAGVRRGA
jgi:anti-sigma regulatory factor (Ser/Thr protein kinase)